MTKKELENRVQELEEREIKLEFIVSKYQELIDYVNDSIPLNFPALYNAHNMSMHLFSEAEVRVGIDKLVQMEIQLNNENEE